MSETESKKFGLPKPVSTGDTITLKIESQGGHGDGIAKVDGFVVFVKGAVKGEECKVRIIDVKRTFATAEKV
jgi:predicted RNA-binding protein with TRAM domain